MFGYSFLAKNGTPYSFKTQGNVERCIETDDFICFNNMIDKFTEDKIFQQNDQYFVVLDGVVLNKKDFIAKYPHKSWFEIVITLYESLGDAFFKDFRGGFSGVLFDKSKKRYVIFSDHIGSKYVFYTQAENALFVSSMMSECYAFLQQNNIHYGLKNENAYLLLSYGYMLDDRTICDKIFKIQPSCYLTYEHNTLTEHQYYMLNNTPNPSIKENDALELMDQCFRKAIQLEFDKDLECGYQKHLVNLSAGLDSRMVCWVAHEMGYTNQVNTTFSQSNYWDQTVPQKISADLKHDWLFKSLDNGLWLYDVEEISKITGGNSLYYGSAHNRSFNEYLNFNNLGLIHSGQLGDVVFSSFYRDNDANRKFTFGQGAYSEKYLSKIKNIPVKYNGKDEEIGNMYCRGFSGANSGLLILYNYSETASAFYDVDLMDKVFKIPLDIRFRHKLYKKWIITKYPHAADYVWENMGCKITRKFGMIPYKGRMIKIEDGPRLVMLRLLHKPKTDSAKNMNPIGYYINTNIELRNWIDAYMKENIDLITDKTLKQDILDINSHNNYSEKLQAMSLLGALKMFY